MFAGLTKVDGGLKPPVGEPKGMLKFVGLPMFAGVPMFVGVPVFAGELKGMLKFVGVPKVDGGRGLLFVACGDEPKALAVGLPWLNGLVVDLPWLNGFMVAMVYSSVRRFGVACVDGQDAVD